MHSFPQHLLDGYAAFIRGPYAEAEGKYKKLAKDGQTPTTMVIACCDSRAAPETIFDAGPGELFVLRNVANLVPTFQPDGGQHGTSAGIEFAVNALEVANLVVLGHGRCGGIRAALNPRPRAGPGRLHRQVDEHAGAGERRGREVHASSPTTERETVLERLSVRNSINNLRTFPYIQRARGRWAAQGAWRLVRYFDRRALGDGPRDRRFQPAGPAARSL